ncbi:MAG: hypothetical protein ACI8RP_000813 [Urechidicola sp.]|jgi:hypothetical protein
MNVSENIRVLKNENIELFVLGALFTFPILKLSFISVLVALLGVYVMTSNRKLFFSNLKDLKTLKTFLIITLWVFLYWLTFFFSEDKERALVMILRTIPLILIPFFMLYGIKILSYNKIRKLMAWFSIVSFMFLTKTYVLVLNALNYFKYNSRLDPWNIIENFKEFSIYTSYDLLDFVRWAPFEHDLELHRTYFSLCFVLCGIFWIYDFFDKKKSYKLILALLFIVWVFYFGSIPNVIAILIIILFVFIRKVRLSYVLGGVLIFSLLLTYVITKSTYLSAQLNRAQEYSISVLEHNNNSTIGRIRYLDVFLELYKEKPLFGFGSGDVQNELLRVYEKRAYDIEYNEKKNTHNYYFHLLLVGGIPLLLLFLGALFYFTKEAVTKGNYLLLFLVIVFAFNLISENILVRIQGVYMFSLFLCVFSRMEMTNNLEKW